MNSHCSICGRRLNKQAYAVVKKPDGTHRHLTQEELRQYVTKVSDGKVVKAGDKCYFDLK